MCGTFGGGVEGWRGTGGGEGVDNGGVIPKTLRIRIHTIGLKTKILKFLPPTVFDNSSPFHLLIPIKKQQKNRIFKSTLHCTVIFFPV